MVDAAYHRAWRAAHPESVRESRRRYRERHAEQVAAIQAKRTQAKAEAEGRTVGRPRGAVVSAIPIEDRLWAETDRRGPDECWPWLGRRDQWGYGSFTANKRQRRVHRIAWELANDRPVPQGLIVRHTCDNPPCVNPAHLLVGTQLDNVRDAIERGRYVQNIPPAPTWRGESHPNHKLTEAAVRDIRSGVGRASDLAARYGVTVSLIYQVRRGIAWGHVR